MKLASENGEYVEEFPTTSRGIFNSSEYQTQLTSQRETENLCEPENELQDKEILQEYLNPEDQENPTDSLAGQ